MTLPGRYGTLTELFSAFGLVVFGYLGDGITGDWARETRPFVDVLPIAYVIRPKRYRISYHHAVGGELGVYVTDCYQPNGGTCEKTEDVPGKRYRRSRGNDGGGTQRKDFLRTRSVRKVTGLNLKWHFHISFLPSILNTKLLAVIRRLSESIRSPYNIMEEFGITENLIILAQNVHGRNQLLDQSANYLMILQ